jgi:hypothetical protein
MSPDDARAWIRVVRDAVIYSLATVILVTNLVLYVTRAEPPNVTWIAAAAFFYGLAPALRADEWLLRGGKNGNGNGNGAKSRRDA